ncbi:hypothetical protein GCM10027174_19730 [Salinifilum aidingensis]
MRQAMVESHQEVLDQLAAQLAGGQALQGTGPVMEALAQGRVETLLLRSAAHGNAQFTEILPGTDYEDGVAAMVRY